MPGRVAYESTISFLDHAATVSTTKFLSFVDDVVDAVTDPTAVSPINTLQTAIEAMSLATVSREASGVAQIYAPTSPTDDEAYNSAKLTVYLVNASNGDKSTFSIPSRNPASYNVGPDSKTVILTGAGAAAATIALVTAIEAAVYGQSGELMTVRKILISGRKQA